MHGAAWSVERRWVGPVLLGHAVDGTLDGVGGGGLVLGGAWGLDAGALGGDGEAGRVHCRVVAGWSFAGEAWSWVDVVDHFEGCVWVVSERR